MSYPERLELTCVCCPMGCSLVVERTSADEATYVSGAGCARGKKYAPAEATRPERVVTTTVCVPGAAEPLSVRTVASVPRELMAEVVGRVRHRRGRDRHKERGVGAPRLILGILRIASARAGRVVYCPH